MSPMPFWCRWACWRSGRSCRCGSSRARGWRTAWCSRGSERACGSWPGGPTAPTASTVPTVSTVVRPMGAGWGVLLGLGWLVRPELVVFSAVFLALVLVAQRGAQGWRSRAGFVAAAVAIPLAYQVFRMGYFGMAVSNTAIAKEGTDLRWGRGWAYLRNFADPYWLWLPLLAMVAGAYVPLVRALRARGRAASSWVLLAFLGLGTFSGPVRRRGRRRLPPRPPVPPRLLRALRPGRSRRPRPTLRHRLRRAPLGPGRRPGPATTGRTRSAQGDYVFVLVPPAAP